MNDNNFYSEYNDQQTKTKDLSITETNTTFIKAYLWMFTGALVTFLTGLIFTNLLKRIIVDGNGAGLTIFLILAIIAGFFEFVLCFTINKNALVKTNFKKALIGFMAFSIINGFTFASFFIYFDVAVLYQVFGAVTVYYLVLTLISYLFRKKIHKASGFALCGLISLLIVSCIVSLYALIFYNSSMINTLYLGINIFGLIIFSILTMVDIKAMHRIIDTSLNKNCASIAAAFSLYLDFINIFVYLLRILLITGKNSRKK